MMALRKYTGVSMTSSPTDNRAVPGAGLVLEPRVAEHLGVPSATSGNKVIFMQVGLLYNYGYPH
jgi:hypothetical protein